MKKKPELVEFSINPDNYDFLIIGTPVWTSNYTSVIRTFLLNAKLKGKKIALFCCYEGVPEKTLKLRCLPELTEKDFKKT